MQDVFQDGSQFVQQSPPPTLNRFRVVIALMFAGAAPMLPPEQRNCRLDFPDFPDFPGTTILYANE